jgi:hypothetical protein
MFLEKPYLWVTCLSLLPAEFCSGLRVCFVLSTSISSEALQMLPRLSVQARPLARRAFSTSPTSRRWVRPRSPLTRWSSYRSPPLILLHARVSPCSWSAFGPNRISSSTTTKSQRLCTLASPSSLSRSGLPSGLIPSDPVQAEMCRRFLADYESLLPDIDYHCHAWSPLSDQPGSDPRSLEDHSRAGSWYVGRDFLYCSRRKEYHLYNDSPDRLIC